MSKTFMLLVPSWVVEVAYLVYQPAPRLQVPDENRRKQDSHSEALYAPAMI
jgi:hypothetical protein